MTVKLDKKTKTYFIDLSLGTDPVTGKRQRTTRRGFKTKKEALAVENQIKNDYYKGVHVYNQKTLFGDFYEEYFEWYKTQVRENTYVSRRSLSDKHILPHFSNFRLSQITPLQIAQWQQSLIKDNYSQSYIRLAHIVMQQILSRAVRVRIIAFNAATEAGNVRREPSSFKFWTRDEFERFQAVNPRGTLRDNLMYAAYHSLFWSGLRLGELLGLSWDHLQDGQFRVERTLNYKNQQDFSFGPPKTRGSVRKVDLDSETLQVLQTWRQLQSLLIKTDLIFTDDGAPVGKSYFSRHMRRYAPTAGVEVIRTHDLRHSHASYLIHLGIDILSVSQRLGHASQVETLKTYGHLYPDANAHVLNTIQENL